MFSIDAQRLLAHLFQAWFGNGQVGLPLTHYSSDYFLYVDFQKWAENFTKKWRSGIVDGNMKPGSASLAGWTALTLSAASWRRPHKDFAVSWVWGRDECSWYLGCCLLNVGQTRALASRGWETCFLTNVTNILDSHFLCWSPLYVPLTLRWASCTAVAAL